MLGEPHLFAAHTISIQTGEQRVLWKLELDITTTTLSFTLPGQFSRQNLSHNVYRSGALQHFLGLDLGDRP